MPFVGLDASESQALQWSARRLTRCGVAGRDVKRRSAQREKMKRAYLMDLLICHAVCHIVLVLEDEERRTHEALVFHQQRNGRPNSGVGGTS